MVRYREAVMKRTIAIAVTLAALLASSAFAKDLNPADFPLTAHVVSFQDDESLVDTLVIGVSHAPILHIRIGNTEYIVSAYDNFFSASVGKDFPARFHKKKTIEVLVRTDNGKLRYRELNVQGYSEVPRAESTKK
jgi:hypothetical protein